MKIQGNLRQHKQHQAGILMRFTPGRRQPVPGLYCLDCGTWLKWLPLSEAELMLANGALDMGMLPEERHQWYRTRALVKK